MRVWLVVSLLVACAAAPPEVSEPEVRRCERYAEMGSEEALRELSTESRNAEKLGIELGAFQGTGVPDDDPRSLAVAIPLGETLGRIFAICTCNQELARTSDCAALRAELEGHFGL